MTVGSLVTCTPTGTVIMRQPFWPWPIPGEYPKTLPNGNVQQFFPHSYTRFTLGAIITPWPPVPFNPPITIQGV